MVRVEIPMNGPHRLAARVGDSDGSQGVHRVLEGSHGSLQLGLCLFPLPRLDTGVCFRAGDGQLVVVAYSL
jgi:hypothetical protein